MAQVGRRIPLKNATRPAYLDQHSPWATPILKAATTVANSMSGANPMNFNLPGGYVTRGGDCVVVAMAVNNASFGLQMSGLGANWTTFPSGTNPQFYMAVGWNCTANNTQLSVGNTNYTGDIIISVWGNILSTGYPISSFQATNSASASTITSPGLTYTGGQLIIGAAGGNTSAMAAGSPGVWSDGGTNNVIFNSDVQRSVRMEYELPISNSLTTLTETAVGTTLMNVMAMALIPAPLVTYPYDAVPIITPRASFYPISRSVL